MKLIILLAIFSLSSFSKDAKLELKFNQPGFKKVFKINAPLKKVSLLKAGDYDIQITPQSAKIQNIKGIILKMNLSKNGKVVSQPTLFVKENTQAEFSNKSFKQAPKDLTMLIKAKL